MTGTGHSLITQVFLSSVSMPSSATTWPKYVNDHSKNLCTPGLSFNPTAFNFSKTASSLSECGFGVAAKKDYDAIIRIVGTNSGVGPVQHVSIKHRHTAGTFVRPTGKGTDSKNPRGHTVKVVKGVLSFSMSTCW